MENERFFRSQGDEEIQEFDELQGKKNEIINHIKAWNIDKALKIQKEFAVPSELIIGLNDIFDILESSLCDYLNFGDYIRAKDIVNHFFTNDIVKYPRVQEAAKEGLINLLKVKNIDGAEQLKEDFCLQDDIMESTEAKKALRGEYVPSYQIIYDYSDHYEVAEDYKDIPRYELIESDFEEKIFIEKTFDLKSGSRLVVLISEFKLGCFRCDIHIIAEGEEYDEEQYWDWESESNRSKNNLLIKGDGSLEAFRKAFVFLRDEIIPKLKDDGADELWALAGDESRSKVYAYLKRLGFIPMIEIKRDDSSGEVVHEEGFPDYILRL
jgi:hypothetical protein